MIVHDKFDNPSNYAMVVISEGASMLGGLISGRKVFQRAMAEGAALLNAI